MPEDLKFFFKTTRGHHIVMGRNTFQEFGVSKPLPDRVNIILSREKDLNFPGTIVLGSIEEAIRFAEKEGEDELFIIGGGHIYEQTIHMADKLYLTYIHTFIEDGHVFFPKFDNDGWKLVHEDKRRMDKENPFDYTFTIYERKS